MTRYGSHCHLIAHLSRAEQYETAALIKRF
jgi:hypothetical protein